MRNISLFSFILFSLLTNAQQLPELVSVSLSENQPILYRGYNNEIELIIPEGDANKYYLIGENCSISKMESDEGKELYGVKVSNSPTAIIRIAMKTKDGEQIVSSTTYKVKIMPEPTVFIDNISSGGKLRRDIRLIKVGYERSALITHKFEVISWIALINGTMYTGNNYMPTDELKALIKKLPSGTSVELKVTFKSPDNDIKMTQKGLFTIE